MNGGAPLKIDFRRGGNARAFLGEGWSDQEDGQIWSVGSRSSLAIPGIDPASDYRLSLRVWPCLYPPHVTRGELRVSVGGETVGAFMLWHETTVECRIRKGLIPDDGVAVVTLDHPDFVVPSLYGSADTRELAVALIEATLEPAPAAQRVEPASEPPGAARNQSSNARSSGNMKIAALTFVFNESVNLPIWINYYGQNFGKKNLFVVDRESDDGSTADLGDVNKIVVPRDAFDDTKKAEFMSSMQNALLNYYDVVVCGDCDELVVPDLSRYANLSDYVNKMDFDYVTCIGLNVRHVIHQEPPLDLALPILAQRRYATFFSPTCKTLLSRVPIRWQAGLHCLDRRPRFDRQLYMLHTKAMDYSIAAARYKINHATVWSAEAVAQGHGAHHRYEYERSVREMFVDPLHIFDTGRFLPFDFSEEIARFESEIVERNGFYWIPMNIVRHVELPGSLRTAF